MSTERVIATRTELGRILSEIDEAAGIIRRILERPEPRPVETDDKGWPAMGWEAHDDPEQQP